MKFSIWQAPAGQGAFSREYDATSPYVQVWETDVPEGDAAGLAVGRWPTPPQFLDAVFTQYQRVAQYAWHKNVGGLYGEVAQHRNGTWEMLQLSTGTLHHALKYEDLIFDEEASHWPPHGYEGRSLTAGDLVKLGDDWWFCAFSGWEAVKPPIVARPTHPEPPVVVGDYVPTDPDHPGYRP